jgi:hypothetical protein
MQSRPTSPSSSKAECKRDHYGTLASDGQEHGGPTFGRQAIPMTWDYADINPFGHSCNRLGGCSSNLQGDRVASVVDRLGGSVGQVDAGDSLFDRSCAGLVIATDPRTTTTSDMPTFRLLLRLACDGLCAQSTPIARHDADPESGGVDRDAVPLRGKQGACRESLRGRLQHGLPARAEQGGANAA